MFERVLIANRGEIACRVMRTCRRLGIRTIAVYSEADRDAQHVRQADEAWPIGGPAPADSYLRGEAIIEVARRSGAQAIHPGYGFLSENAGFARACVEAGIAFIGPRPESIEAMGSKAAAKALMAKHPVPLVPGYYGADQDAALLAREARKTGFPLMIKPAAGGGGKGMHIVRGEAEFPEWLATAQRESLGAFGDSRVILERYVEHPRHIEFQVFGDTQGHVIHLNERECSAQRRYQKVLEETPSPNVDAARRKAMGEAAVAAAKAVAYVGAGTVEFIVGADGHFYFMEMNTRLQVEHAVTEMTLGLDLVEWQLRVAAGEPLPLEQKDIHARGHAIEARLYAEDPEQQFLPSSGKLIALDLPEASANVRLDAGVVAGDTVTIFYDPMIAKLIVHDVDRARALARMRRALAACNIIGPKSNVPFLERLVRHPVLVNGEIDTGYIDSHLDEFLDDRLQAPPTVLHAAACVLLLDGERAAAASAAASADPYSPWARPDGWRVGPPGARRMALMHGTTRHDVEARGALGHYDIALAGRTATLDGARWDGTWLDARFDGEVLHLRVSRHGNLVIVHDAGGQRFRLSSVPVHAWAASDASRGNQVIAPMPGRIVMVKARAGDTVKAGDELIVMEAMKMELALKAPRAGTIQDMQAVKDEFVDADAVLVRFAD